MSYSSTIYLVSYVPFKVLLATSLLLLLVITSIAPAVNAQETAGRTVTAAGSWSTYDVTRSPLVKPEQNLGSSFYIGPLFWIDGSASSAISSKIGGIGIRPMYSIGSAQKPVFDLHKMVFICNIV